MKVNGLSCFYCGEAERGKCKGGAKAGASFEPRMCKLVVVRARRTSRPPAPGPLPPPRRWGWASTCTPRVSTVDPEGGRRPAGGQDTATGATHHATPRHPRHNTRGVALTLPPPPPKKKTSTHHRPPPSSWPPWPPPPRACPSWRPPPPWARRHHGGGRHRHPQRARRRRPGRPARAPRPPRRPRPRPLGAPPQPGRHHWGGSVGRAGPHRGGACAREPVPGRRVRSDARGGAAGQRVMARARERKVRSGVCERERERAY